MRVAVVGAGAVGLYFGAKLQRAGHEVRFLVRRDYEALAAYGLSVTSPEGNFHLEQVQGFRTSTEIGTVDLVLVAIKTVDNSRLVELVAPLMGSETLVLTVQNGLGNEDLLADAFGPDRILGGIAIIAVHRGEPGVVHHHAHGSIRFGEFAGGITDRTSTLADTFSRSGIPCDVVADFRKIRWEKLVWNITFNGLCTVTGKTPGQILSHVDGYRLATGLMREVIAGANSQNLTELLQPDAFIDSIVANTLMHTADYRPSMAIDRQEGRPLELNAIYRIPLEFAAERGCEMVRVRMLHDLLAVGETNSE
ncbi:MAG: 2-dehydropantoate 2-reductase [Desulfuromonadaceae bacterium]